jgi:hypothetical protein
MVLTLNTNYFRGLRSISASNSALIVIDGSISTHAFDNLNPRDIESLNVLGATAALYGSLVGNGAIN